MIIDSHHHFWKYDPVRDTWITDEMKSLQRDFFPEDLKNLLRENGIDGVVSVQADQSDAETEFLLSLANKNDFIKGVVGWIDLRADDLQEKLSRCKQEKKLKGFRHIVQGEPSGFLDDNAFIKGVNTLGEFGYTYDLLIYHHQLEEALRFVHRLPEVKIVIDHLAKPSIRTGEKTHWELQMAAMATFPNVYCKISGMVTEAVWQKWKKEDFLPYLDEVLESFGPSRLMYGSDWPVCLLAATYGEQIELVRNYISTLTSAEQEAIMGKNAIGFYNLE
jgi:L-fuconolactonase